MVSMPTVAKHAEGACYNLPTAQPPQPPPSKCIDETWCNASPREPLYLVHATSGAFPLLLTSEHCDLGCGHLAGEFDMTHDMQTYADHKRCAKLHGQCLSSSSDLRQIGHTGFCKAFCRHPSSYFKLHAGLGTRASVASSRHSSASWLHVWFMSQHHAKVLWWIVSMPKAGVAF